MANNNTTRKYEVTKTFLTGVLAGLTITETTSVKFEVGVVYGDPKRTSYRVLGVR